MIDSFSEYDNTPWELITASFQNPLSPEEQSALQEWLAVDATNLEKYSRLLHLWQNDLPGYELYRQADPHAGWNSLRQRMASKRPFIKRRMITWTAAAAIFIAAILIGNRYFFGRPSGAEYETGFAEQKTIPLPDGSFITLEPGTRIRLANDFNSSSRTLFLEKGTAYFEILHNNRMPFTVEIESSSVRDIGTRFTIRKTKDSVLVSVMSGKVAFRKNSTGETRELGEGVALSFRKAADRFGTLTLTGLTTDSGRNLLKFEGASLSAVITILQRLSGNKIILEDQAMGVQKLTVRLDGESFEDAIKIICASLDLEYTQKNDAYILKMKGGR